MGRGALPRHPKAAPSRKGGPESRPLGQRRVGGAEYSSQGLWAGCAVLLLCLSGRAGPPLSEAQGLLGPREAMSVPSLGMLPGPLTAQAISRAFLSHWLQAPCPADPSV